MDKKLIDKTEKTELIIDNNKINEVAERISKTFEMPIDKASSIIKIGTVNAVMLNRFRGIFIKHENEEYKI